MRWLGVLAPAWILLGLWRTGPAVFDSLWSEDALFLTQARDGVGLLEPYMGYVLLLPRLVAAGLAVLPLQWAAAGASLVAASVMAACAALVFQFSQASIPSPWLRGGLATYLVLIPVAGPELSNAYTYIQWPLVAASAWVILGAANRAWVAAFLAGVALSAPQVIVLAPLALYQGLRRRWLIAGGLLGGLAVQYGFILAEGAASGLQVDVVRFIEAFLTRVVGGLLLGDVGNVIAWTSLGPGVYLLVMACIAMIGGVLLLVAAGRPGWNLPVAFTGLAVAFFLFCAVARNATLSPPPWIWDGPVLGGARYYAVPVFWLASAACLALVRLQVNHPGWASRAKPVLVAIAVAACLTSYATPAAGREGTSWSAGLDAAATDCEGLARVETAPAGGRWGVVIPCGGGP